MLTGAWDLQSFGHEPDYFKENSHADSNYILKSFTEVPGVEAGCLYPIESSATGPEVCHPEAATARRFT